MESAMYLTVYGIPLTHYGLPWVIHSSALSHCNKATNAQKMLIARYDPRTWEIELWHSESVLTLGLMCSLLLWTCYWKYHLLTVLLCILRRKYIKQMRRRCALFRPFHIWKYSTHIHEISHGSLVQSRTAFCAFLHRGQLFQLSVSLTRRVCSL